MHNLKSIVQRLEARKYRITPARLAVVTAVLERSGHFSVDDIVGRVPGVGRATVFRTMKLLSEMGMLCRVLLEDGSLSYRVSRHQGHHHHLVCVSCASVQELDACIASDMLGDLARSTGFQIEGHWLEFFGRCAACRNSVA
ncbi:MAG: transcriptional repressor [Dehalococcoidia bacterium]|nr:transcriptional repressor [Dehalococcoidia bacterium]